MYQLNSLESSLKHFFGYDAFRPGQRQVITEALQNRDVLVIMPTGGGKSLCYQLPALLRSGVTIVVSPLIALMKDQVDALQNNGVGATFLNSSLEREEVRDREQQILSGSIKLLYVAPERLLSESFIPFLDILRDRLGLASFAIDEAHCVSEWGHDFRPEYRQLRLLRQRYPDTPMMALTATATQRVQQDIINQLALQDPHFHISSFNRPNLYYGVIPKEKRSYPQLLKVIQNHANSSGIVYCLSRKNVEEIAARLQRDNVSALPYHGGMTSELRNHNQTRFIRDDVQIIVATIAFGMGINKPDVRFVVHYDLPRNLEGYYQESGRAGRDGENASCILLYSSSDIFRVRYFIEQKTDPKEQRIAYQQLEQMIDYAEATSCRRTIQLSYFGEKFKGNCQNCDNCRDPKPIEDWTIEAQKFLSCVARTKEKFGMIHIIDVLRGSRSKKVESYGHHLLSTYGIGKDRSKDEWKMLARALLHQGLMNQTQDGYNTLKLNKKSWEVLRKQREVSIAVTPQKSTKRAGEEPLQSSDAQMLFEKLRKLRKQLADANGVPPYVIFADYSLRLMAEKTPQNLDDFAKISGVGAQKLERYGEQFVSAIREFCYQNNTFINRLSDTQMQTLELYRQGLSLAEIAEARQLKTSTISTHLSELIKCQQDIDINRFVSSERQGQIIEIIQKVGFERLTPIKDCLDESFSYDEIRLVCSWWQREGNSKQS
ncbi:DNA helicase RecQ [Spirulina subsalsa]|uniref:DNA helicase RecQ n=1 Tax=Spirulina subsalsa TaxID=54311 RepID=UPI00031D7E14|nr:DNA helicase RecQ [Spirulina subsalsa]